jgi:type VI protein secretion system component Hcp
METVSFVFGDITWTYTDGGVEHQDVWSQRT